MSDSESSSDSAPVSLLSSAAREANERAMATHGEMGRFVEKTTSQYVEKPTLSALPKSPERPRRNPKAKAQAAAAVSTPTPVLSAPPAKKPLPAASASATSVPTPATLAPPPKTPLPAAASAAATSLPTPMTPMTPAPAVSSASASSSVLTPSLAVVPIRCRCRSRELKCYTTRTLRRARGAMIGACRRSRSRILSCILRGMSSMRRRIPSRLSSPGNA